MTWKARKSVSHPPVKNLSGDQNVNETRSPVSSLLGPTPPNALSIGTPRGDPLARSSALIRVDPCPISLCVLRLPVECFCPSIPLGLPSLRDIFFRASGFVLRISLFRHGRNKAPSSAASTRPSRIASPNRHGHLQGSRAFIPVTIHRLQHTIIGSGLKRAVRILDIHYQRCVYLRVRSIRRRRPVQIVPCLRSPICICRSSPAQRHTLP